MQTSISAAAIIVGLLLAGIGLKHFKQKITVSEYFLLDGKLSLGPFVSTMVSTNLSLGNLIYVSAIWGFSYGGSSVLWLCIALIVFVVALTWPFSAIPVLRWLSVPIQRFILEFINPEIWLVSFSAASLCGYIFLLKGTLPELRRSLSAIIRPQK